MSEKDWRKEPWGFGEKRLHTVKDIVEEWDGHKTKRFRFYMQAQDGKEVEWVGLTRNQAVMLYNLTTKNGRDLLNMFNRMGWEEVK